MDVEWQVVKLPMCLSAKVNKGVVVKTVDGDEIIVPFFFMEYKDKKDTSTIEEKLSHYARRFQADVDQHKQDLYEAFVVDNERPPKVAIVFVSEDLTISKVKPSFDLFAWAEIGIACFDTDVDLNQFKILK